VHVGGAWHLLKQGWVRVSGVWQQFFQSFTGQVDDYTVAGSYTETIPPGASQVTIESWGSGAGGQGGKVVGMADIQGSGGGAGGYAKSIIALTSANWSQTMATVVGAAGVHGAGNNGLAGNGNNSSAASGTFTLTSVVGDGGGAAPSTTVGGTGGSATGGNSQNTAGGNGQPGNTTAAGGIPVNGVGGANAGAGGSGGITTVGQDGGVGRVRYTYV
jgi:hypothetical protein